MSVHVRNRVDSVRPELILEDWSLDEKEVWGCEGKEIWTGAAVIHVKKITNQGKGPAFDVRGKLRIDGTEHLASRLPSAGVAHDPVPVLSPGKELLISWMLGFYWEDDRTSASDRAVMPLKLVLSMTDLHGRLHETTYQLMATKGIDKIVPATNLAPGLSQTQRYTKVISGWRLWWRSKGTLRHRS